MTDTGFADTENATACTYREEVVENDIVYDVLDVVIEEEGIFRRKRSRTSSWSD
jgi:hypothetical protein